MFKQFQGVMIALTIAVGILSLPSAALAIEINIENDGKDHAGQIIVILGSPPFVEDVEYCGIIWNERRAVILDLGGGERPLVTTVGILANENAQPGDRYEVIAQAPCDGRLFAIATRIFRRGIAPILFLAPADLALDADHVGVVTGQADQDGTYPVLLKKPGQKPVMVPIFSHLELWPSDVLVGILELDVDPETGSVLYGAYLEY